MIECSRWFPRPPGFQTIDLQGGWVVKFEEVGGYALLNRFCECVAWSREFFPGPIFGPASPHNFGRVCPKCDSFLSGDSHDLPYHDVPSRKYQVFGFICP